MQDAIRTNWDLEWNKVYSVVYVYMRVRKGSQDSLCIGDAIPILIISNIKPLFMSDAYVRSWLLDPATNIWLCMGSSNIFHLPLLGLVTQIMKYADNDDTTDHSWRRLFVSLTIGEKSSDESSIHSSTYLHQGMRPFTHVKSQTNTWHRRKKITVGVKAYVADDDV